MQLLDKILSKQNMNEAYLRVFRNKGASGVDGITVDELKQYLKENKDELRQRIRTRKYQPQAASGFSFEADQKYNYFYETEVLEESES